VPGTFGADNVPYALKADKPPSVESITKAMAEKIQALVPSGTKSDGRIVVVESGAPAYKAMSGDATIDKTGKLTIANKDGEAATPSMRTLGTGAKQAAAGNDSRLSDERVPLDGSATSRKTKLTAGIKRASKTETFLTNVYQDIEGTTLEITPEVSSLLLVNSTFHFQITGAGGIENVEALGRLMVDEVGQAQLATLRLEGTELLKNLTALHATVTQSYVISLTAAKHVLKLQAGRAIQGTAKCFGGDTALAYTLIAS
jgi:hypothetical protein